MAKCHGSLKIYYQLTKAVFPFFSCLVIVPAPTDISAKTGAAAASSGITAAIVPAREDAELRLDELERSAL